MRIETTKIGKWMAKVSIEIILLEIHIKTLLSTWVEIMMDIQKVDITTILKQMAIVVKIWLKEIIQQYNIVNTELQEKLCTKHNALCVMRRSN